MNFKKFIVSEQTSEVLDKQQTQLQLTSAVSIVGLVFVTVINLITVSANQVISDNATEQLDSSKED